VVSYSSRESRTRSPPTAVSIRPGAPIASPEPRGRGTPARGNCRSVSTSSPVAHTHASTACESPSGAPRGSGGCRPRLPCAKPEFPTPEARWARRFTDRFPEGELRVFGSVRGDGRTTLFAELSAPDAEAALSAIGASDPDGSSRTNSGRCFGSRPGVLRHAAGLHTGGDRAGRRDREVDLRRDATPSGGPDRRAVSHRLRRGLCLPDVHRRARPSRGPCVAGAPDPLRRTRRRTCSPRTARRRSASPRARRVRTPGRHKSRCRSRCPRAPSR